MITSRGALLVFLVGLLGRQQAFHRTWAFVAVSPNRNPLPRSISKTKSRVALWMSKEEEADIRHQQEAVLQADASKIEKSTKKPEEILTEEECANLFQFLLRDLQVEGVPLLAVDAEQVDTMQAALWTTMAELLVTFHGEEAHEQQRACLILEDIPLDALRSFVDDFRLIQTTKDETMHIPELQPFRLSMVGGKGVGPAILMEIGEPRKKKQDKNPKKHREKNHEFDSKPVDDIKITAAMKMFVDRILEWDVGLEPERTQYRACDFSDVCHVLSSFWNSICQLQATSADDISSIVLALPNVSYNDKATTGPQEKHDRFAAVAALINRSLGLYRGDEVFDLLHMHPTYKRQRIFPPDQPAFGHLPPTNWIQPILKSYFDTHKDAATTTVQKELSAEDLKAVNYLRRAPVTSVVIKRVALMDQQALQDKDAGETELELADGVKVTASAVAYEAKSILKVVELGKEALKADLLREIEVADVQ